MRIKKTISTITICMLLGGLMPILTPVSAAFANEGETIQKQLIRTQSLAPKKVRSLTVKAKKKSMTLRWKKDTYATGYQIVYAGNKKFTKGKKTITIKKNSTTRRTIKKLKTGKVYYVKVRAYKTVNGVKYYGSYSNVKKAKVK